MQYAAVLHLSATHSHEDFTRAHLGEACNKDFTDLSLKLASFRRPRVPTLSVTKFKKFTCWKTYLDLLLSREPTPNAFPLPLALFNNTSAPLATTVIFCSHRGQHPTNMGPWDRSDQPAEGKQTSNHPGYPQLLVYNQDLLPLAVPKMLFLLQDLQNRKNSFYP